MAAGRRRQPRGLCVPVMMMRTISVAAMSAIACFAFDIAIAAEARNNESVEQLSDRIRRDDASGNGDLLSVDEGSGNLVSDDGDNNGGREDIGNKYFCSASVRAYVC